MKTVSRSLISFQKKQKSVKVIKLKMLLFTGEAKNNSELGPLLGQHQINIVSFCNDYNKKSLELYNVGVFTPVELLLNNDKSYRLNIRFPVVSFLLNQLLNDNKNVELNIENLYDIVTMLSFFQKKSALSIAISFFGYLSSYNNKLYIKIPL